MQSRTTLSLILTSVLKHASPDRISNITVLPPPRRLCFVCKKTSQQNVLASVGWHVQWVFPRGVDKLTNVTVRSKESGNRLNGSTVVLDCIRWTGVPNKVATESIFCTHGFSFFFDGFLLVLDCSPPHVKLSGCRGSQEEGGGISLVTNEARFVISTDSVFLLSADSAAGVPCASGPKISRSQSSCPVCQHGAWQAELLLSARCRWARCDSVGLETRWKLQLELKSRYFPFKTCF